MPGAAAKTMKALVEVCAYAHAMSLANRRLQEQGEECGTAKTSSSSNKEQKNVDHDAMLVRTMFVLGNLTAGTGPSADANRRDTANAEMGSGGGGIDGLRLIGRIISSRAHIFAEMLATLGMIRLKQWEGVGSVAATETEDGNRTRRRNNGSTDNRRNLPSKVGT